jgi:hypothetical protein
VSLLLTALLLSAPLLSATACGEDDPAPLASVSALVEPTTSTSTTERLFSQTQQASAVHERVMTEHRERMAAAQATSTTDTVAAQSSAVQQSAADLESPSVDSPTSPASSQGTTALVLTGGQTPLTGVWSGTAEQLASYLLSENPWPFFTVSPLALAKLYVAYCAEAGLRADLLWAQMIHETGYGSYGGDVSPEQNNYAGIGATGAGAAGAYFLTPDAGVLAHVAHMVAYVYDSSPVPWASAYTDPRFDSVSPRGAASVLADLNGRWAVPGTYYGQAVEAVAQAINAR